MVVISELILAHICAFICGIEVWCAIKSVKNNRPISFAFDFSLSAVTFLMTVKIFFLFI